MSSLTCRQCGAELFPGTNFCRQCGTAIAATGQTEDERGTTLFDESDLIATQRLDPRHTSPEQQRLHVPVQAPVVARTTSAYRVIVITAVVLLALAGIVGLVSIRMRKHARIASANNVIYPGARKLMDVVADGGGRAIELDTSDSVDSVANWYRTILQPQKVVQLTSTSVVMKNEKTTVTIVGGDNRTNILIKTIP